MIVEKVREASCCVGSWRRKSWQKEALAPFHISCMATFDYVVVDLQSGA